MSIEKINKTVSISTDNMELIADAEIVNLSKFINELLEDALTDKTHAKRLLVKKLNKMQLDALSLGFILSYDVKENKK